MVGWELDGVFALLCFRGIDIKVGLPDQVMGGQGRSVNWVIGRVSGHKCDGPLTYVRI